MSFAYRLVKEGFMKTTLLIISILALGLMGVGCSKSNSNSDSNNNINGFGVAAPAPIIIDPIAPGGAGNPSDFGSGYTGALVTTSAAMRAYTTIPGNLTAINNPQNIRINLNLAQSESGRYGGAVTISYTDNGVQRTGVFRSGMGRNQTIKGGYDNDRLESDYNYWFTFENQLVFTGFMEDDYGAITITLTPDVTSGGGNDAEPLNVTYKGEIYFRNFKTLKSTPYRACWFIYTGINGHDCRSNVIQSKSGLTPGVDAGYTKLGSFTNVNIKQAFNMK
jgi:hypothetical protein